MSAWSDVSLLVLVRGNSLHSIGERLSTALLLSSIDVQPVGRQMLHAAGVIAASLEDPTLKSP